MLLFFKHRQHSGSRAARSLAIDKLDSTTIARCSASERLATPRASVTGRGRTGEETQAVLLILTGTDLVGVAPLTETADAEITEGPVQAKAPHR